MKKWRRIGLTHPCRLMCFVCSFIQYSWIIWCIGLLLAVTVLDLRSFCTDDGFVRGLQKIPYWCRWFYCWLIMELLLPICYRHLVPAYTSWNRKYFELDFGSMALLYYSDFIFIYYTLLLWLWFICIGSIFYICVLHP